MQQPLRIAICEDLPIDSEHLSRILSDIDVLCRVELFQSGEAFLLASPAGRFDLIFLDIYMDGMSGIDTAKLFREQDRDAVIVFTTTSPDHALESFGVNAMQYLIKPVTKEAVADVVERLQMLLSKAADETLTVVVSGERVDLPIRDILYIEVYNKTCTIHLKNEKIDTAAALDDLAALLPTPEFLRCHQSYVVNLNYVASIDRDFKMTNGDTVYIRRGDVRKCVNAYKEYLLENAGRDDR